MRYLDLFSGIGGFALAVKRRFHNVKSYHSEINRYANKVYDKHFPYSFSLGDVENVRASYFRDRRVDLFTAGFPCQSFTNMGKREKFGDDNGRLFFKTVELLRKIRPRYFILENVASMENSIKKKINYMVRKSYSKKTFCTLLDSKFFSAQVRKRLFWTNFKVNKVIDRKNVLLQDILVSGTALGDKARTLLRDDGRNLHETWPRFYNSANAVFKGKTSISKVDLYRKLSLMKTRKESSKTFRLLFPIEYERLQTFPDNWTDVNLSTKARCSLLGNSVTVDVISHILTSIP